MTRSMQSQVNTLQLPIFPAGTTPISEEIAFECQDGLVVYVHGHLPVFQHAEKDLASFRLFTSQLVVNGTVGQVDVARAFHVPLGTVKRYAKLYRNSGPKGFFTLPKSARRQAPRASGVSKTAPRPWGMPPLGRPNGRRRRWGGWVRLRHRSGFPRRAMFLEEGYCWRYRLCWRPGCCATIPRRMNCRMVFTASPVSFC